MKKIAGIYKITNGITNKFYIGSSVNIPERIKNHKVLLRGNRHTNKHLQAAWNKYGEDSFKFEILEEIFFNTEISIPYRMQYLECVEQTYIDSTQVCFNGYNISPKTGNPHIKRTPESLEKARRTRIERGTAMKEETKKKISNSLRNSDKCKRANREMNKKREKIFYKYDLQGNFIEECSGICNTARELGVSVMALSNSLKRKGRVKDYMFRFEKCDKIAKYSHKIGKHLREKRYIKKIDKSGNVIRIYNDRLDCSNDTGIGLKAISSAILSKSLHQKTFYLEYGEYHR